MCSLVVYNLVHVAKWAKLGQNGLKMGGMSTPNGPRSFLETQFGALFDAFLVTKRPILKAFWDVGVVQMAPNGLQMGLFHMAVQPKLSTITVGKTQFSFPF